MEAPVDSKSTDSLANHEDGTKTQRRVGIVYDERMCKHYTPDGDDHPEQPDRIRSIWNKLQSAGVTRRCVVMNAAEAEDKYLLSVHSKRHVDLIRNISSKQFDSRRNKIASKLNSIYFNQGSTESAYLAAGAVVQAAEKVAEGELDSAVAIVRPPGHHAEHDEAMGFCLFNNVAVAASFLLNEKPDLGIKKILIVDWDVHHGNGTQKMFWKDPRVLFFSVHRHEFGWFYPCNDDGDYTMIGEGPGVGYNINVPWEQGRCGDADYFAVWDHILLPVAKEFNPDIILVSAGFDAAMGDPLGGCCVTPFGYSVMLKQLIDFAQGKIMLVLEGGYNLNSIANSMLACLEVLLNNKPIDGSSEVYPFESTWRVIQQVRQELRTYWPILGDELPKALLSLRSPLPNILNSSSDSEIEEEKPLPENLENVLQGVIEPLSMLNISEDSHGQSTTTSSRWRLELSQIYVWYAAYGSNVWKPRFLCYIEGGQVEGMHKPCSGSVDRTSPKDILWKTVPFHLFFGRDYCNSWGAGAVAFLNPEMKTEEKTHMCLYKISLEQFNDILIQENDLTCNVDCPLFDVGALNSITNEECNSMEVIKEGWYGDILYLGKEDGVPILTITCGAHDIQRYKNAELPLGSPSEAYANTIIRGLVEGKVVSEAEAIAYVKEAAARSL